ncbi:MAG: NahK/ErcS family hybrid sensor histidine kinase/response regulator [Rhizobiaceae bacterium]
MAAVATLIVVIGTVPYISLQLKAVTNSVSKLISHYSATTDQEFLALGEISILIAITLALFTILFGTRHADATEHQDGLMLAVAVESVVKIAAFLCVGIFVTYFMFDGFGDLWAAAALNTKLQAIEANGVDWANFTILTILSLLVFLLLPRQFHVTVVENHSESELRRARWLFPVYLVAINLFVLPIAAAGVIHLDTGVNADDFVLLLPLSAGNNLISIFAFIGGLSAGAAMVVVACVALAIMISNNLVLPLILRRQGNDERTGLGSMEHLILQIRRTAILVLLFLAYTYYRAADNSQALASIGLVSFAAIAQLSPSFFGGLLWQGANSRGAIAGMTGGFSVWAYTLLLPTLFDNGNWLVASSFTGSHLIRPGALFDLGLSPFANGLVWSLAANALLFAAGSLSRKPSQSEMTQAALFVTRRQPLSIGRRSAESKVSVGELTSTVSRYLGSRRTERAFEGYWNEGGGKPEAADPVDPNLLRFSEQLLASAIGASSSRLVHTLLLKRFEGTSKADIELLDQASEALQYNRDVLQTALDQMDQGVSVFDSEYRLAFWNRRFRRLLGLPASFGQAGVTLNAIAAEMVDIHGLDTQQVNASELGDKIVNETQPWLLALSASEKILEIRSSSMPGGGIVVTWHDITDRILVAEALRESNETLERRVEERTSELVRANQKLERATKAADQANASKTRFLAAAGHDILQPLNAARLYTSALMERVAESKDAPIATNIGKALESVEDILGAILAISRLDTGKQETSVQAFPLSRIFDQMEVEFKPIAEERNLDLVIIHSSLWVQSDPALLRRLVQNLISNALKYTPEGRVVVGARRSEGKVRILVADTGIGIDQSDQKRIYSEFQRLDGGKKQAPGLGLGLSIVDRISRVLGHSVVVKSKPGSGSIFSVEVPRATPAVKSGEGEKAGRAPMQAGMMPGLFVVCIDNDNSILEGMATLLTQWGCTVRTAPDGDSALAAIREVGRAPDTVLADYHLDNETGMDAIADIRRSHGTHFPCVLVTADRSPGVKAQADAEQVPLLNKPVRPAALRALLARSISGRQAAE